MERSHPDEMEELEQAEVSPGNDGAESADAQTQLLQEMEIANQEQPMLADILQGS